MTWLSWLRSCSRDQQSPAKIARGALGMLTGQDARALAAISACWELYASSDSDGEGAALGAVRSLLPALQEKCRFFARELIAMSLDWSDRDRVWSKVTEAMGSRAIAFRTNGDDWHEWSLDTTDDESPRRLFVRLDDGLLEISECPTTSSSPDARALEGVERNSMHVFAGDLRQLAAMLTAAADKLEGGR